MVCRIWPTCPDWAYWCTVVIVQRLSKLWHCSITSYTVLHDICTVFSTQLTVLSLSRPNLMQTLEGTPVFVHAGAVMISLKLRYISNDIKKQWAIVYLEFLEEKDGYQYRRFFYILKSMSFRSVISAFSSMGLFIGPKTMLSQPPKKFLPSPLAIRGHFPLAHPFCLYFPHFAFTVFCIFSFYSISLYFFSFLNFSFPTFLWSPFHIFPPNRIGRYPGRKGRGKYFPISLYTPILRKLTTHFLGPFANIAHGNSSIIADQIRLENTLPSSLDALVSALWSVVHWRFLIFPAGVWCAVS